MTHIGNKGFWGAHVSVRTVRSHIDEMPKLEYEFEEHSKTTNDTILIFILIISPL